MTNAATAPQKRRFSLAQLAFVLPWIAIVIDAWSPIGDNSFLWHIRAGTLQAETGAALISDPFSFTMNGVPWRTQSWLVELLYAWGESFSGLGFVPWMLLLTTSLTFAAVGLIAFRHSGSQAMTVLVLIMTTVLMISFLVPRPVVFSYLLFTLVILAWDAPRYRWAIPLLFWIWASAHGSFVIGLAYIGFSMIARREWRWVWAVLTSSLAALSTAHGLGVIEVLVDFAKARDALAYLTEWRKPTLDSPVFLPFVGGIAIILIGSLRGKVIPRFVWVIAPFLILGMSSLRAIPPAWLALLPIVSLSLSGVDFVSSARFGLFPAVVFVSFVLIFPFSLTEGGEIAEDRLPVLAAGALADLPTFHDDVVGGYLIWAQGPERLVFLDDRAELYGDRVGEFVRVRSGQLDWSAVFERDDIQQVLLATSEDLVDKLTDAGWETVHRDDDFVVLRS